MDVARSSVVMFTTKAVSVAASFAATVYFARELGAAKLGVFFLFLALLNVMAKPADLGINVAVEKRISEGGAESATLTTAILVKGALLSITVVALYLARDPINGFLGAELALLFVVALVFQELSGFMISALVGELRVEETAYINFAYKLVKFAGGALLVFAGFGLVGLVWCVIGGFLVRFVLAFRARETKFGAPEMDRLRSITDYAKYSILPEVEFSIHQWMDVVIIGFFLTNSAVGQYEVAWKTSGPVLLLTLSIAMSIFPQISAWESSGSKQSIEDMFARVIVPSMILVIPAFFGVLVLSKDILTIIYGPEYEVAWLALILIVAGKIPHSIRLIEVNVLLGLDQPRIETISSIVDIISNLVLNLVLIYHFGIVGAAVGTVLSLTIGTAIRTYFLSKFIELRIPYDKVGWCFVAGSLMGGVLFQAKSATDITSFTELAGFVFTGALLYGLFVLLYPPLKDQIANQVSSSVPWPR